jgi:hypothetical protein
LYFITKYIIFFTIEAVAWAKPSRSQAMSGGFGLARGLTKPKPGLPGQAGPYTALMYLLDNKVNSCSFAIQITPMDDVKICKERVISEREI